jgi:hypothetical protein
MAGSHLKLLGRRVLNVCVKFWKDEVESGVRSTSADTLSDQPLSEWPAGQEADRTLAQRTAAVGLTDRGSLSELALMADHRCGVPIMSGRELGGLRAKPSLVDSRQPPLLAFNVLNHSFCIGLNLVTIQDPGVVGNRGCGWIVASGPPCHPRVGWPANRARPDVPVVRSGGKQGAQATAGGSGVSLRLVVACRSTRRRWGSARPRLRRRQACSARTRSETLDLQHDRRGNRCSRGSVGSCGLSWLGGGTVVPDKRPTRCCRRTPNGHGPAPPWPTTTK